MNKRRRFLYVTVVFVLAMALVGVLPALATPPDRLTIPIAGSFVLAQCDGFNVIDEYAGTATFTDHYNRHGELEKISLHINTQDRVYNSVTGFEVFNNFAYNETYDLATSQSSIRGLAYNITVPGYGIVYFDSGLGIFVIVEGEYVLVKFSGNYQADAGILCEAMDQ